MPWAKFNPGHFAVEPASGRKDILGQQLPAPCAEIQHRRAESFDHPG